MVSLRGTLGVVAMVGLVLVAGCRQDMHDQPRIEPFESSELFADGSGSRPLERRTVARGFLREDTWLYNGTDEEGDWVEAFPFVIDRAALERGRERYDIFCAPCHDRTGGGRGIVVRRGYPEPAVLYSEKVRGLPAGVLFDNITTGFGNMPALGTLIPPRDRWLIVAYLRALQLSQRAPFDDLPTSDQAAVLASSGEETGP